MELTGMPYICSLLDTLSVFIRRPKECRSTEKAESFESLHELLSFFHSISIYALNIGNLFTSGNHS